MTKQFDRPVAMEYDPLLPLDMKSSTSEKANGGIDRSDEFFSVVAAQNHIIYVAGVPSDRGDVAIVVMESGVGQHAARGCALREPAVEKKRRKSVTHQSLRNSIQHQRWNHMLHSNSCKKIADIEACEPERAGVRLKCTNGRLWDTRPGTEAEAAAELKAFEFVRDSALPTLQIGIGFVDSSRASIWFFCLEVTIPGGRWPTEKTLQCCNVVRHGARMCFDCCVL